MASFALSVDIATKQKCNRVEVGPKLSLRK